MNDHSRGGAATQRNAGLSVSPSAPELNALADRVLDSAFSIHRAVGPGLLESFYQKVLARDLERNGLHVEVEKPISVEYDGMWFERVFYADLVIEECLTVEIKSVTGIHVVHTKQLLTYIRLQRHRLGLLLNFGAPYMKDGIKRVVNGL